MTPDPPPRAAADDWPTATPPAPGGRQQAPPPAGVAPPAWDPGPPSTPGGLAWLLDADPRGDDLDTPGSEIDTNHEGRIEGRLRQNIDQWRAITKDERVLDLILNGLKLEFVDEGEPPELCSDRNNIPPELEGWTAQQIEAMLQAGAISTWDEHADMLRRRGLRPGDRPRVISPILVHEKPSSTPESRKYRFIVDARELNKHLIKRKFKLQSLHEFTMQLRQGDYLWSLDLASAYFHVSVHWRHATYLRTSASRSRAATTPSASFRSASPRRPRRTAP